MFIAFLSILSNCIEIRHNRVLTNLKNLSKSIMSYIGVSCLLHCCQCCQLLYKSNTIEKRTFGKIFGKEFWDIWDCIEIQHDRETDFCKNIWKSILRHLGMRCLLHCCQYYQLVLKSETLEF